MGSLLSWTNLAVATVGLVLVLIAFRVFGHIRFTFRFRGAVTVSPWAQKPCPHLGLLEEPFIHRDDPSEEHRCYLWMQRDRIDLTHQKGFCLSSAHAHCPWMSIAPPVAKAPIARKLGIAAPVVLGSLWTRCSDEAVSFLVWLVLKLNRASLVVRQWADKAVPVVVTLAVIAGHEIATRGSAAGKSIARASGIAGYAFLVWLRTNAAHFGSLARDSAREAWTAKTRAAGTATPPATADAAAETTTSTPPSPAPGPVAPGWRPAPAGGAASHLDSLVEQGKTAGMSGNRKLAYSLFSLALDLDPKNDDAWLWKGAMTDNAEEKFVCLQQALAINPKNQKAQQAYRQMTQGPWAAQAGLQGAATPRGHGMADSLVGQGAVHATGAGAFAGEEALIAAALAILERGDEEGANRLFVRATEVSPGSEKAWFWRAKTSSTLGDVIYSLKQALVINPDNEKVKANLLWAIQRHQREQVAAEDQRKAARVEATSKREETRSQRRSLAARFFRWVAALCCLALAAYWILVAFLPLLEIPAVREALVEVEAMAEIDLSEARTLYHNADRWVPQLTWAFLPWSDKLEVTPDYNLLAAVPYVIGFLYFFVSIGLGRREGWSRFWALAASMLSLVLSTLASTNGGATMLLGALGIATIMALILSRHEFKKEPGETLSQQVRNMKMPATKIRESTF